MKELEKFSLLELKGMVFDLSQQSKIRTEQLQILYQEINRRQQEVALNPVQTETKEGE